MAGIRIVRGTIGAFRLRLGIFHDLPTQAGSLAHAGIQKKFEDFMKIVRSGWLVAGDCPSETLYRISRTARPAVHAAYSGPKLPVIPVINCHPQSAGFRSKVATFGRNRWQETTGIRS